MSLREVARNAGIAPTSFYRHFKDLDELGLELVDQAQAIIGEIFKSSQFNQLGLRPRKNCKEAVELYVKSLKEHPDYFQLVLKERNSSNDVIRNAISKVNDGVLAELEMLLSSSYEAQGVKQQDKVTNVMAHALMAVLYNNGLEILTASDEQVERLKASMIDQVELIVLGHPPLIQ
jgi:AcrR family transcriptional regulator